MGFKTPDTTATPHDLLGAQHSDTVPASPVQGDLIVGNSTPAWERYGIGTEGEVLTVQSGMPVWTHQPSIIAQTYFLTNDASDIAGYKSMTVAIPTGGETSVSAAIPAADTAIEEWVTPSGFPATTLIPGGVWHIHIHAAKTAGTKTARVYAKVYKRTDPGGVETLLGTFEATADIAGAATEYDIHTVITDTVLNVTDRIVVKFLGTPGGAGTDPTVALYYLGSDSSRLEMPVSTSTLDHGTLLGLGDDDHTQYLKDDTVTRWVKGLLYGLTLANGADATNDIDIAAGVAGDGTDGTMMTLASGLTKQLDAAWAVGTNAGMRASGAAIADTTYHIFLIKRPDTGVVDVAADTSATGANIAANTAAAYTKKRRIGSIIRAAGTIVGFVQHGDTFNLKDIIRDWVATNPGTNAVSRTHTVPVGIIVEVHGSVLVGGHSTSQPRVLISDLATNDTAPVSVESTIQGTTGANYNSSYFRCFTDTSAQVRTRLSASDAGTVIAGATFGWRDLRE